jgi:acyl-[acyl-carrier-protein]-phospholipid O-acyltransferase/long-chain-fatty-acid--[acyl-carrier-protein] ligase
MPEIAVPRKIQRVEALPLLGTGKTDYVTLKKMAEAV